MPSRGCRVSGNSEGGSRSSAGIGLQAFLEPMMGVRFLVEGVDFDISFLSVQCLSLGEGPIGFQMEHCKSGFPGRVSSVWRILRATPRLRAQEAVHIRLI